MLTPGITYLLSISPGVSQCVAARSRMREDQGGIAFVADSRSMMNSQKEIHKLVTRLFRMAKVSDSVARGHFVSPPTDLAFLDVIPLSLTLPVGVQGDLRSL
jgi:hypothetical protein